VVVFLKTFRGDNGVILFIIICLFLSLVSFVEGIPAKITSSPNDLTATTTLFQELSYDDGGQNGMSSMSNIGDIRVVRFTPTNYPFNLTFGRFYLFSNNSFRVHVFDDDGVNNYPNTDLINPFNTTVYGSDPYGQWQNITLPTAIQIYSGDFYVGLETLNTEVGVGLDYSPPIDNRSHHKYSWSGWYDFTDEDFMIRASGH